MIGWTCGSLLTMRILALPIDSDVDLQGAPKNSVHIRMDFGDYGVFLGEIYRNFQGAALPQKTSEPYEQALMPSAKDRSTFELRISRSHVKFGMPTYNLWWIDTNIADLGWSKGILQLGHHSYNPQKNCASSSLVCLPNTWHWDNVNINPATPFTMIEADRRYVLKGDPNQVVNFAAPAPASAFFVSQGLGRSRSHSTMDHSFPPQKRSLHSFQELGPIIPNTSRIIGYLLPRGQKL